MIAAAVEILALLWRIIVQVFTHRWSRLTAIGVCIFLAGAAAVWFGRPRPVQMIQSQTKSDTREGSYSMGRIGLRIKGGTTVLTLDAVGVVISISNTGGELLMVERVSASRSVESRVDHREQHRTPMLAPVDPARPSAFGFRYGAGPVFSLLPAHPSGVMATAGIWRLDAHLLALYPPALFGALEYRFR